MEIPNNKHQIPNKSQTPNSNDQNKFPASRYKLDTIRKGILNFLCSKNKIFTTRLTKKIKENYRIFPAFFKFLRELRGLKRFSRKVKQV